MNNITITKDTDEVLEFDFVGSIKEANNLRRILVSDIPTMAIDEVEFATNTSVFHNDFLAHRLGLIPLKADARKFEDDETFVLTLEAENKDDEILTVNSSELKGDYSPVHQDIPIVRLGKGQKISAKMIVRKGAGEEDAKWMVTCPVGFRYDGEENEKEEENKIHMSIETTGVYTPKEVLEIGLEIRDKIKDKK